jgi:hypothetical protein
MLKYQEPNPLNIHGLRQLDYQPPHFTPVHFELYTSARELENWIWENLEGRFYFGDHFQNVIEDNNRIHIVKCAAFENASEASYFSLVLSTINVKEESIF